MQLYYFETRTVSPKLQHKSRVRRIWILQNQHYFGLFNATTVNLNIESWCGFPLKFVGSDLVGDLTRATADPR